MLRSIAREARRAVGAVNTETVLSEAVESAIEQMAKAAEQAGVVNAKAVAESSAKQALVVAGGLTPGRKFRVFRDAVSDALVKSAASQPVPVQSALDNESDGSPNTGKIGKRSELRVFAQMLQDGLDVYIPLVDDHGVDAIVCWKNGPLLRVQVKSRENSAKGNHAKFRIRPIPANLDGLYFVFYSKHLEETWLMSAKDFIRETGGQQAINFRGKHSSISEEYMVENFNRLKEIT